MSGHQLAIGGMLGAPLLLLDVNIFCSLIDDAEACFRRSQAFVEKITDYAAALEGMSRPCPSHYSPANLVGRPHE